jgi:hypothetical protein
MYAGGTAATDTANAWLGPARLETTIGNGSTVNSALKFFLGYTSASNSDVASISLLGSGSSVVRGGILHGTWTAENSVTSSDRRLKVDILPLYTKLVENRGAAAEAEIAAESGQTSGGQLVPYDAASASDAETDQDEQVLGVIRRLRPVAFRYKKNAESKYSHYGFIAQEIETVLPELVTTVPFTDGGVSSPEFAKSAEKAIRQADLVAVITVGLQSLDHRLLRLDTYLNYVEDKVDYNYVALSTRIKTIESIIKKVVKGKRVVKQPSSVSKLPVVANADSESSGSSHKKSVMDAALERIMGWRTGEQQQPQQLEEFAVDGSMMRTGDVAIANNTTSAVANESAAGPAVSYTDEIGSWSGSASNSTATPSTESGHEVYV